MKKIKYRKRVSPGIFNKVKVIKSKKKFIKYFGEPIRLECDMNSKVQAVANMNAHIEYCQVKNFEEEARKAFPKWEYKEVDIKSTPAIGHRISDVVRHIPINDEPAIDPMKIRGQKADMMWIYNDEIGGFEEI